MVETVLGIIGGSGIYDMSELEDARWIDVETPWGVPSDSFRTGKLNGLPVVFLPRHGRNHQHAPGDINYRANIDAMKRFGVTDIVSLSACGSFRENVRPGSFVIVDQLIDRTRNRPTSFFGSGCVAHVSLAHPISPGLAEMVTGKAHALATPIHETGTYLAMEGPQFSTLAESEMYRNWGCDVIGMTAMPEARLAREAEICYCIVAMVTDFDCWHPEHGEVDIPSLSAVLKANTAHAKLLINDLATSFPREHPPCPIGSDRALEHAIITPLDARDPESMARLDAILARFRTC